MKSVNYDRCSCLNCGWNADVFICVDPLLSLSGAPYIPGNAVLTGYSTDCHGKPIFQYALSYNEGYLSDSSYDLVSADIQGVICSDCLTNYIDYQATQGMAGANNIKYIFPTVLPTVGQQLQAQAIDGNTVTLVWA